MMINQNLEIDSQYYIIVLKPAKNTKLHASLFVTQKIKIFNNELADDNKTSEVLIKPKAQLKAMLKGKKQSNMLEIKKNE